MGTPRWSKRSAEQLQKLNKDSNLTVGLEAELIVAICARVMHGGMVVNRHSGKYY